jgi:hypothetical protein
MAWIMGLRPSTGERIFLFATASRPALGLTHPPIQWIMGTSSPWVKWPGLEAYHSPRLGAEVNEWSYSSTTQYDFMARYLARHRDNLPIYLYTGQKELEIKPEFHQRLNFYSEHFSTLRLFSGMHIGI